MIWLLANWQINWEISSYLCGLLRKPELYSCILHSNVSSLEYFLFILPKEYSWLTLLLILMTKLSPTCFLIVSSAVTIVSSKTWKLFLLRTNSVLTSYYSLCSETFAFYEMTCNFALKQFLTYCEKKVSIMKKSFCTYQQFFFSNLIT